MIIYYAKRPLAAKGTERTCSPAVYRVRYFYVDLSRELSLSSFARYECKTARFDVIYRAVAGYEYFISSPPRPIVPTRLFPRRFLRSFIHLYIFRVWSACGTRETTTCSTIEKAGENF